MTDKREKARAIDGGLQQARHIKEKEKPWTFFAEYVPEVYCSGIDKYGDHIEASKDSFENRWHKARAILLTSK